MKVMTSYSKEDSEPCVDKACAALTSGECKYPLWYMCGHPVERVDR